jgi:hypothetical protein
MFDNFRKVSPVALYCPKETGKGHAQNPAPKEKVQGAGGNFFDEDQ